MKLTQDQETICLNFLNGMNILVNSVAGSGKTTLALSITTLIKLRMNPKAKILYACFNRSISDEMTLKMVNAGIYNTTAKTLHSIGLNALKKINKPIQIDGYKVNSINRLFVEAAKSDKRYKGYKDKTFWSYIYHIKSIFEFSRYNGSMTLDYQSSLELYEEAVNEINWNNYDQQTMYEFYSIYTGIYKEITFKSNEIVVDFTDMIYLPIYLNLNLNQNVEYMLMDEVQDFNRLQHVFVNKIMIDSNVKQFIAVGDPKQSIYGFAGSNPNLFTDFLKKPNTVELSMDQNFRCSYLIIEEANKVYNNLKTKSTVAGEVNTSAVVSDVSVGSFVIARKISTLLKGFFTLAAINMPVTIKDENVIGTISSILKKYKGDYLDDIIEVLHNLIQAAKDPTFGDRAEMFKLIEEMDILLLMKKHQTFASLHKNDIIAKLQALFNSNEEDIITMCSIHKSKGLESDEVTILNIGEIPLESAKTPFQIAQEYNLKYVALTRAKLKLNLLNI